MGPLHAAARGHVLRHNKNREEGAMAQSKGIRRVVTAHDAAGKAVVGFDGMASVSGGEPELGVATITLWVTDGTPAGLDGTKDARETEIGIPPPKNGSIFRIVDFHPTTKEMEKPRPELPRQNRGSETRLRHQAAAASGHASHPQHRLPRGPVGRDRHAAR